ncbi:MAG: DJ-1/PfpI family protein [Pirellulaceae bacterium]
MSETSIPNSISRRQLLQLSSGLSATCILGCTHDQVTTLETPIQYAKHEILMLVYPRFTTLDLIGPQHVFALLGPEYKTRLVWKDKAEVISDTGVPIRPTMSFDDCRPAPEILFIPGGTDGTLAAMEDKQVRDFVAKMGAEATYVTSVCTGSLILGAAGLLNGYKATSHWLALKVLKEFGAEPLEQRVVVDRNRITGAGVTAGIDFALTLTSLLKDDDYAKSVQLMMEYDPQPPFESGNLKSASAESVKLLEAMADPFLEGVKATKVKIATQ